MKKKLPFTSSRNGSAHEDPEAPARADDTTPPWLKARYEFHGVYGDLAKARESWKTFSFVLLVCLLAVTGTLIYRLVTSNTMLYAVKVDDLGRAVTVEHVASVPPPTSRVVEAQLTEIITGLRTVSTDAQTQQRLITEAFTHLTEDAREYVTAYYAEDEHDPRLLSMEMHRRVDVTSILPMPEEGSDDSSTLYKVEWVETTIPEGTGEQTQVGWQAYARIVQHEPTAGNPFGIYVTALSWSQTTVPSNENS